MSCTLSILELDLLRKLVNGELVTVPPALRLRFELAGVIREGAQGIAVTDHGRRLAKQTSSHLGQAVQSSEAVAFDKRGRRMPLRRRSVF